MLCFPDVSSVVDEHLDYYQFEIQVCGIGELHDADNEPPIEQSKGMLVPLLSIGDFNMKTESQLSRGTSAVTETDQRSTGVLSTSNEK